MEDCSNCDCDVLRNRVQELEAQVETLMDIIHCTMDITTPFSFNYQESGLSISETETVSYSEIDVQTDSIDQSAVEIQTVETEVDCSSDVSVSDSPTLTLYTIN